MSFALRAKLKFSNWPVDSSLLTAAKAHTHFHLAKRFNRTITSLIVGNTFRRYDQATTQNVAAYDGTKLSERSNEKEENDEYVFNGDNTSSICIVTRLEIVIVAVLSFDYLRAPGNDF